MERRNLKTDTILERTNLKIEIRRSKSKKDNPEQDKFEKWQARKVQSAKWQLWAGNPKKVNPELEASAKEQIGKAQSWKKDNYA